MDMMDMGMRDSETRRIRRRERKFTSFSMLRTRYMPSRKKDLSQQPGILARPRLRRLGQTRLPYEALHSPNPWL